MNHTNMMLQTLILILFPFREAFGFIGNTNFRISDNISSEETFVTPEEFNNTVSLEEFDSLKETTISPPWTECLNGHGYRSLAECKTACNLWIQSASSASLHEEKVTHKLIVLEPDEFMVDNNCVVTPHFKTNDFVIRDGKAEICYPLQEKFVYCHKRCVSFDEINVSYSNELFIGSSEMPYNFDDFYLVNSSNDHCVGAAVCETGTTFIIFPTVCLVFSTACVWMIVIINHIFPNQGCNRIMLYHLITFGIGFVITAVKSVTTLYHSYYLPTDDCMVLTNVQEFFYILSYFSVNINMREIYLLMLQDLSQSIIPGNNYSRRKQQEKIIFRFSYLMVSLLFGLFTFMCELIPMAGFFPEFVRHCAYYRNKHHVWFKTYYSWMVFSLFSNIILFLVTSMKFCKWNNTMNNNTNNNMDIRRRKVMERSFLHLTSLLLLIILYWSSINYIVPWDTTTSVVTGVIEMSKALQGIFLFILYVRSISLLK